MAVTDWNALTTITRSKILPGFVDQIKADMPLVNRILGKAQRIDGGHRIEQIVKYANSTQGGFYSGLDSLKTSTEQVATRAYWPFRQVHQAVAFSNIDIAKNGGNSKVLDMLKTEMEWAKDSLKDRIGTSFYTAQTGDAFESLVDACDDSKLKTAVKKFGYMLGTLVNPLVGIA